MKIAFAYDIDKDVDNFVKTLKLIHDKELTPFHKLYIDKNGESFEPEKIKAFIEAYISSTDIGTAITKIEKEWAPIQSQFIQRIENIFGIKYPQEKIMAYLTTNHRCSYNICGNYFFVYLHNKKSNNSIIMHEIFHFYTWHTFYQELMDRGVSKEKYNDIKESLTELLNLEFADLLDGAVDSGYPQHQEMREKIRSLWFADKNLSKVVSQLK